jgi:hypothetical protein
MDIFSKISCKSGFGPSFMGGTQKYAELRKLTLAEIVLSRLQFLPRISLYVGKGRNILVTVVILRSGTNNDNDNFIPNHERH